jgi:hypothetical protein
MASGKRIVVFEVSGAIKLPYSAPITITQPDITIAGQTAPGEGITITGAGLFSSSHDIVVRFIRVRGTDTQNDEQGDALRFTGHHAVFDHCSFGWACDETADMCHSYDVTVQWCIFNESSIYIPGTNNAMYCHPEGAHNYGLLHSYGNCARLSIHHSLFTKHLRRNPMLSGQKDDFRNNVVYAWGTACVHTASSSNIPWPHDLNVINNYFKWARYDTPVITGDSNFRIHVSGNINTNSVLESGDHQRLSAPFSGSPQITTHTAEESYDLVLQKAGAMPRDSLDRRNVRETITKTGWIFGRTDAPLTRSSGTAPRDSDNDGMPDAWETENRLNPNSGSDASGTNLSSAGYTNIEVYLNELADDLIQAGSTTDAFPGALDIPTVRKGPLNLFPNPVSQGQRLNVSVRNSGARSSSVSLELFDTMGRKIRSWKFQQGHFETSLDFQGLDGTPGAGLYLMELRDERGKSIQKKTVCYIK